MEKLNNMLDSITTSFTSFFTVGGIVAILLLFMLIPDPSSAWKWDNTSGKSVAEYFSDTNTTCFKNQLGVNCGKRNKFTADGKTMFNSQFLPNNKNHYYAFMAMKGAENPQDTNFGDRDSCGSTQQRVSEIFIIGSTYYSVAQKFVKDSMQIPKFLTEEEKNFVIKANQEQANVNGGADYNKIYNNKIMSTICQRSIDTFGINFYEQVALERFKSEGIYDFIKNVDIENEVNYQELARKVCGSQRPYDCASYEPNKARSEWWDNRFIRILKDMVKNKEYEKKLADCVCPT